MVETFQQGKLLLRDVRDLGIYLKIAVRSFHNPRRYSRVIEKRKIWENQLLKQLDYPKLGFQFP
jgi:positive regulator of sigma E activity